MKTFCPSCERETNCVYVAELYECKECGCDFESRQRLMQERAEAAEARLAERAAEVARLTEALSAANEDAELPDYNPNGTANPKGDAAYWRTRAEAAEARAERYEDALAAANEDF